MCDHFDCHDAWKAATLKGFKQGQLKSGRDGWCPKRNADGVDGRWLMFQAFFPIQCDAVLSIFVKMVESSFQ